MGKLLYTAITSLDGYVAKAPVHKDYVEIWWDKVKAAAAASV